MILRKNQQYCSQCSEDLNKVLEDCMFDVSKIYCPSCGQKYVLKCFKSEEVSDKQLVKYSDKIMDYFELDKNDLQISNKLLFLKQKQLKKRDVKKELEDNNLSLEKLINKDLLKEIRISDKVFSKRYVLSEKSKIAQRVNHLDELSKLFFKYVNKPHFRLGFKIYRDILNVLSMPKYSKNFLRHTKISNILKKRFWKKDYENWFVRDSVKELRQKKMLYYKSENSRNFLLNIKINPLLKEIFQAFREKSEFEDLNDFRKFEKSCEEIEKYIRKKRRIKSYKLSHKDLQELLK